MGSTCSYSVTPRAAPPPVNGQTNYTFSYYATLLLLLPLLPDRQIITLAHILSHPVLLLPLLTDRQITLAHILQHTLLLLPLLMDRKITLAHITLKPSATPPADPPSC